MPDITYNQNELFKLKHAYALAEQIATGFKSLAPDDSTKITLSPTPTVGSISNCTVVDGVCTVTIPLSDLNATTRAFTIKPGATNDWTVNLTGMPQWFPLYGDSRMTNFVWARTNGQGQFVTNTVTIQAPVMAAQSLRGILYYPASFTHKEYRVKFNITITDD